MYIRERADNESEGPVAGFDRLSSTGPLHGFAQSPPVPPAADWKDLISFVPPTRVQKEILGRGLSFHRIEDGVGPVNLDYYGVEVTSLRQFGGSAIKPEAFLELMRRNLNDFIDKRLTWFSPKTSIDGIRLTSRNPLGAVLHLDFYRLIGKILRSIPIDDGSVVISDVTPRYWRVYTIWTPTDHGHPLSGAREWGFTRKESGYVFYTRAADRLTKSVLLPFGNEIYAAQHTLWMSFQHAIATFVRNNGGQATILPPVATRHDWTQLSTLYHRRTVDWVTA